MNSISLIQIGQNIAQFITGPGGITLITIGIAIAGCRVVFSGGHHWGALGGAIGGGAAVFAAGWIVERFLSGSGASIGI